MKGITVHFMVMTISFHLSNALPSSRSILSNQERYNFFDTELIKMLSQNEDGNLLVSPVSIKLMLGMLMEGADGKTAEEIRLALRLPKKKELARKEFDTWLSSLQVTQPPNELKIASQVFLSDDYVVKSNYTDTLKKHYRTGVTPVKFRDPKESSKIINDWVSEQTSRLIPSVVKENLIHSDTKMILTSAVYFKGYWMNSFTKQKSHIRCFYGMDEKCHKSIMMSETAYYNFGYVEKLDAQAIQLPYEGGKYFMLILLPDKLTGIDELCRDLVHVSFQSILSEIKSEEVFVQIPQFEISYEKDLADSLRRLQLSEMFSDSANFSKILTSNSSNMAVNHIFHSAKISVNEEGTEGAAATGALFVPLMGGTTTSFVANHPFLFFIMDSAENSILFAGKFAVPKDASKFEVPVKSSTASKPPSTSSTTSNSINFNSDKIHSTDGPSHMRGPFPIRRRPHFRSVKPKFQQPDLNAHPTSMPSASNYHRSPTFDQYAIKGDSAFESLRIPPSTPENLQQNGRHFLGTSKGVDNEDSTSDSWRHHILFFS